MAAGSNLGFGRLNDPRGLAVPPGAIMG